MSGLFDPFTATLEDALAQPDAYAAQRGAVIRWGGAQQLIHGRERYERYPLDGIAVCAIHALVAPDWLARAYLSSYRRYRDGKSTTEAFGAPFKKGTQVAAMRHRRLERVRVANVVAEFVSRYPSESVDDLYAAGGATGSNRATGHLGEFAARLGVGKTKAAQLHSEAVRMGITVSVDELRAALAWPRSTTAKSPKLAGVRRKR